MHRYLLLCMLVGCTPAADQTLEQMTSAQRQAAMGNWTKGALCRSYIDPFLKPNTAKTIEQIFYKRGVSHCGPVKVDTPTR